MDDYEVLSRSSLPHKSLAINLKFEHGGVGGNTKGPVNMKMKVPGLLVLVLRCSCWGLSAVMCAHRSALPFSFPLPVPPPLSSSPATFVFEAHTLAVCTSADVTRIFHDIDLFMKTQCDDASVNVSMCCCLRQCGWVCDVPYIHPRRPKFLISHQSVQPHFFSSSPPRKACHA